MEIVLGYEAHNILVDLNAFLHVLHLDLHTSLPFFVSRIMSLLHVQPSPSSEAAALQTILWRQWGRDKSELAFLAERNSLHLDTSLRHALAVPFTTLTEFCLVFQTAIGKQHFGNQTISRRCRFIPRKSFHHLQEFKLAWRLIQSSWESRWVKVSEPDAHPTHPQRPISKWTAAIFPINRCATCCLSSHPAVKFTLKFCAQYLLFFVTSLHGLKNKTI